MSIGIHSICPVSNEKNERIVSFGRNDDECRHLHSSHRFLSEWHVGVGFVESLLDGDNEEQFTRTKLYFVRVGQYGCGFSIMVGGTPHTVQNKLIVTFGLTIARFQTLSSVPLLEHENYRYCTNNSNRANCLQTPPLPTSPVPRVTTVLKVSSFAPGQNKC